MEIPSYLFPHWNIVYCVRQSIKMLATEMDIGNGKIIY